MANTLPTTDIISRESVMVLKNQCITYALMRNVAHIAEFTGSEKVGSTIRVLVPGEGNVRSFTGTTVSRDISNTTVNLTIEEDFYDRITITTEQASLKLNQFSEHVLSPILKKFGEKLNTYCASKAFEVPYFSGTAGDPPDTIAEIAAAKRVMNTNRAGTPRIAIVDEFAEADLVSIDAFSHADKRGDGGTSMITAELGTIYGFSWFMDQSVNSHTAGTMSGANPLVDVSGGVLAGAVSMDIDDVGAGSETIKIGDLFTVAGVTTSTGDIYMGVFTNNTTASAGQITGATFYPAAPTGGFPDDSVITIVGSHTKNFCFSPGAFTAVAFPPAAAQGAPSDSFFDPELGLGIRVTTSWDADSKSDSMVFDMLAGAKLLHPEKAIILLG